MMTTKKNQMTIYQEMFKINWRFILLLSFIYADYTAKANDYLAPRTINWC